MTHLGYILAGWSVTLGAIALYAFQLLRRGRRVSAQVPADRRRWLTTDVPPPDERPRTSTPAGDPR